MPWESPGPPRAAQQPIIAAAPARRQSPGDVKMPWDGPGGARPSSPETDAFAAALGDDKGLDEVILEYLSDDSESEER